LGCPVLVYLYGAMQWESTDQFGNLFVGASDATSSEALALDLAMLVQAIFDRHEGEVAFSIDVDYAEVSAPRGDQVSHIVNIPWLSARKSAGESKAEILESVREVLAGVLAGFPGRTARVQGPWD
jgi:hypothetical protein